MELIILLYVQDRLDNLNKLSNKLPNHLLSVSQPLLITLPASVSLHLGNPRTLVSRHQSAEINPVEINPASDSRDSPKHNKGVVDSVSLRSLHSHRLRPKINPVVLDSSRSHQNLLPDSDNPRRTHLLLVKEIRQHHHLPNLLLLRPQLIRSVLLHPSQARLSVSQLHFQLPQLPQPPHPALNQHLPQWKLQRPDSPVS